MYFETALTNHICMPKDIKINEIRRILAAIKSRTFAFSFAIKHRQPDIYKFIIFPLVTYECEAWSIM